MKNYLLLFIIVLFCFSCENDNSTTTIDKPEDPWVFRSVLDQRPRILTAALHENLWVAYDVAKGGLYKSWDGGVVFEGAVYDHRHGPQPTTYGYAYSIDQQKSYWNVSKNGEDVDFKYNYRGHSILNEELSLEYTFLVNGQSIAVEEKIEFAEKEDGPPSLIRTFVVGQNNTGTKLSAKFSVQSIVYAGNIKTDGEWKVLSEQDYNFEKGTFKNIDGTLLLNDSGETRLELEYVKASLNDPNIVELSDEQIKNIPLGARLIAQSDCKTCHNEKLKTVGPAYVSVAERYADTEDNISLLMSKVKKGGSGIWGEQVMNAHPNLKDTDLREMISYVLSLGDPDENENAGIKKEVIEFKASIPIDSEKLLLGSVLQVYELPTGTPNMPKYSKMESTQAGVIPNFDNLSGSDFVDLNENFGMSAIGYFKAETSQKYKFRTWSDDGSILYFHDKMVIDNDGLHGTQYREVELLLEAGYHPFKLDFFQGGGGKFLSFNYLPSDKQGWSVVTPDLIYHSAKDQDKIGDKKLSMSSVTQIPGDKKPLLDVHPSFDLFQARPAEFTPKVGGLDVMDNGDLIVCTWDKEGAVYRLTNTKQSDPESIIVEKIASGLAEPLGLKVVDNDIYVLQKQELTKLVDINNDGQIDKFETICDDWGVTANFHEFCFGLAYKEGHFYATLATGILPGGASMPNQHKDRGSVVKIAKDGSSVEFIANGLRTPNGVGIGYNGDVFVADNQGDWLPSSKIVHVEKGSWFGSRSVDFEGTQNLKEKKPVVWLPQDEIGNSPSTPLAINYGPYKNQMIHGEVTHGGLKRVFVEEIEGALQGCVFRFVQGLEAGINRMCYDKSGSLYVGGIGNPGNWAQSGKKWYGLQRLEYNEKSTFEMLAIRAKSNGIEVEFTEALSENEGWSTEDYTIKQWYYLPSPEYGGPKLDEKELNIRSVNISDDRKKVFLEIDGMKEDHVLYLHLNEHFVSANTNSLWSTEAWYTMNKIPQNNPGEIKPNQKPVATNSLSRREIDNGWELLFDGKSLDNWHTYNKTTIGKSWIIKDNSIYLDAKVTESGNKVEDGGDIVSKEQYENFDLKLEWKISNCGNSGIMFNVIENKDLHSPWLTGPEMQILDDSCHPDSRFPSHRAGCLYDMIIGHPKTVKPAGEWNKVRIISNNNEVEFWQNGFKIVEFEMGNAKWNDMILNSKFKDMKDFGQSSKGHIVLQDHTDPVSFRNIKIKRL